MKRILFLLLAAAALWACRPSAPLIGISCGRTSAGAASLSANYTEAVARAGGIPVIFPTVADSALAAELVRRVDGVIFSGGPDLDPSYYGETVWNETVKVDTLRDVSVPGYPDAGGYVRKARGRRLAPDRRGEGERAV